MKVLQEALCGVWCVVWCVVVLIFIIHYCPLLVGGAVWIDSFHSFIQASVVGRRPSSIVFHSFSHFVVFPKKEIQKEKKEKGDEVNF